MTKAGLIGGGEGWALTRRAVWRALRLHWWMLHQLFVEDGDAALELRVAACDHEIGAIVDFDIGIDAGILHDPRALAGDAIPHGFLRYRDGAIVDHRQRVDEADQPSPGALADDRTQ